ncbi:MAG: Enhancer of polycomb-like protein 1 [Vezdaea aestivalis]|nr:MAG: Enhancer of polycomb-like protein 1 [Vezdaea aestivalis]
MTRSSAAAVGARFRNKKLSTKAILPIIREDASTKIEDDQQRNIQKIETGVEKGEEFEHHLQAAIASNQAAALGRKDVQAAIPTPHTEQSATEYERLYTAKFQQPATYIRFSSTVEDCSGPAYCMNEEDDPFFKTLTPKKVSFSASPIVCSEDMFEQVITFFEETAAEKQPYASVDNPPVITYGEFEAVFDETLNSDCRAFARDIYEHWKSRRSVKSNQSLLTSLKFETGADTDDADPYICFRRREVRQIRKTRGRDALSAEKLRSLRAQLEDARSLMVMVKQREHTRRESLAVEKAIFESRTKFRLMKRTLKKTDLDEDLLILQKAPKKTPLVQTPQSANRGGQARLRTDGRPADAELMTLKELLDRRQQEIDNDIASKVAQHERWNQGYADHTRTPLMPMSDWKPTYRTVSTQSLPTPPASVASHSSPDVSGAMDEHDNDTPPSIAKDERQISLTRALPSPSPSPSEESFQQQFRRRIGRGGRSYLDRRGGIRSPAVDVDPMVLDRHKYDQDDSDEEYPTSVYHMDVFSARNMKFRAGLLGRDHNASVAQQNATLLAQANAAQLARQTNRIQMQGADTVMANGSATAGVPVSSSPPRPGSSHQVAIS